MRSSEEDELRELVTQAVRRSGEWRSTYRGFSVSEVQQLADALGRTLPSVYQSFLLVMGRHTGRAFEYVTMAFDGPEDLLLFQKLARHLIAEGGVTYPLPAGAFFCSNYLDSQLSYFDLDRGEDDPTLCDLEVGNPRGPDSSYTLFGYLRSILTPP